MGLREPVASGRSAALPLKARVVPRALPVACALVLAVAGAPASAQTIDLTMTSLTGAPASVGVGKTFSVSNTVKTTGAFSTTFTVGIYLSTDAVITTSDTLVASRTRNGLTANGSSTASTTATVPTGLAPRVYYVGAIADTTNVVAEASESNNAITGAQITVVGADLTITAFSGAPASVAGGGSFNVSSTAAAASTGGNAGAFTIGFYLSTDNVITTSDIPIGSRAVTSLASGSTSRASTTLVVPASTAAGTYWVGAYADSSGQVTESSETNNAFLGTQITVQKADLTTTSVSGAPATVALGGSFSLSSTVANAAGAPAAGAFSVGLYLSADDVITTSDVLIGSRSVTSLAGGATSSGTTSVTVPTGTAPGIYRVGAFGDSGNQIAESNESNNGLAGAQVLVGPDLTMTSLTGVPASAGVGTSFGLTNTVAASSGGAVGQFTVGFYISADGAVTTADTLIGTRTVASLAAGGASTTTNTVTVPPNLAPGTYFVGAIADSTGAIAEASEANNTVVVGSQLQVVAPDLLMTSVGAPPDTIGVGDGFTVADTVTASSTGAAAGPFVVGYFLSADANVTSADVPLGSSRSVSGLVAGQSSTGTSTITIPAGVAPGTYYFGAVADASGAVAESSEANNGLSGGIVIVGAYSCQHPASPIDDGNPCTVDSCDPITGVLHVPAVAATSCADGDICNGDETCDGAGLCRDGAPPVLSDGNPCTTDTCDPVLGVLHASATPGSPCDDSNACTYADACSAGGQCVGTAITCSSDACNTRTCSGTATCNSSPRTGASCDDGNPCTYADACTAAGACGGTAITCAADACNERTCNGTSSCSVRALVGQPCSDGNACTYADTCDAGGTCAGTPVNCVAAGPCEQVVCDGTASCGKQILARGTACPGGGPATCAQVCDGVSPFCQPIE